MKKLPVSICVVSGAEVHRIGRMLDSVAGWAGEIIVVLNEEVRDGTEELCRRYGAEVVREPWKGFIGQKNSVAEKASQPWLLNIDADEIVTAELCDEIASVVLSANPLHAAYEFPRCSYYCGRWIRHGDWYPDRVCRLWKRGAARWTGQDPHARLKVHGTIGRLNADLQHYTNDSVAKHVAKIIPYGEEFVRAQAADGRQPGLLDLTVRPVWKFLRAYFFRLGFLDGWQGYYIAWLNAFSVVTKYARLKEAALDPHRKP